MARARKQASATSDSNTEQKGNNRMAASLTTDQIMALLSKTRRKGEYTELLNEFVESGEAGVSVGEKWPHLSGKKATTLKQGFEAAKDKKEAVDGADKIVVKSDKGDDGAESVYLINLALVEGVEVPA